MKNIIVAIIITIVIAIGCGERTPKRDHIPIIKNNLLKLQTAVKENNRAAIDSLLSVSILDKDQSSDSLLSFIYGFDRLFLFEQFGMAEFFYTNKQGRIDCYIMDSTHTMDRPFVLFIAYEHDKWLFTSFEEGDTTSSY
jgi:hypothetical protein